MRRQRTVALVLGVVALLSVACGSTTGAEMAEDAAPPAGAASSTFHGTLIDPPAPMPAFELVGTDGQTLRSEDYQGRYVAVYFGYTHCPDICPLTLGVLKRAVELLTPEEQARFAVLMIAVDPERDTPEVLGRYMNLFNPKFEAGSGDPAHVQEVLNSWGVQVTRQPLEGGYNVSHPASVYLLDPEGRWVLAFDHSESPDDVASDLRLLMGGELPSASAATDASTAAGADGDADARERWFFALGDGSVLMREADGTERQVLPSWSEQPSDDDLARRQYPGAREIAYDPTAQVLWFADTHEAIHSINVETGERGPSIDGFADAALPGCGVADLSREFAVLPGGQLIVPTLVGTTVVYSTEDGSMVGALSPTAFGAPLLGAFRPFAATPASTDAWYVDGSGVLHGIDLEDWSLTESAIPALPDAVATALVEVALSPDGSTMYYLAESGELRAWDIAGGTASATSITAPPDTRAIAFG